MSENKNNKAIKLGFLKKLLMLIGSLIIAIVLWYVGTIQDQTPVSRKYSDIPVKITGETQLKQNGLVPKEIGETTVDIIVKGFSSDIFEIEEEDLVAVIDLSSYMEAGTYSLYPVLDGCPKEVALTKVDPVVVQLEKQVKKELVIDVELVGTPYRGYKADVESMVYESMVTAVCGEEESKHVAGAKVVVDITGRRETFTVNVNIVLLDMYGNEIDASKIHLDKDSINVTVPIAR